MKKPIFLIIGAVAAVWYFLKPETVVVQKIIERPPNDSIAPQLAAMPTPTIPDAPPAVNEPIPTPDGGHPPATPTTPATTPNGAGIIA